MRGVFLWEFLLGCLVNFVGGGVCIFLVFFIEESIIKIIIYLFLLVF